MRTLLAGIVILAGFFLAMSSEAYWDIEIPDLEPEVYPCGSR